MPTIHNGKPVPSSIWPQWHENKPFALVLLLVCSFLAVFLMVKTGATLAEQKQIGRPVPYEHQITVEGVGRASAVPDIATLSFGVESKGEDVAAAQAANTASVNGLSQEILALGIDKADVQTANYSVYENSEWNPDTETYEPAGWVVSQSLTVKVRDTSKIAAVIQLAGKNGVTSVSGPSFTVDDPSNLRDEARAEAIADATRRAHALAETLGVRLERVVGYSEYTDQSPMPYYAMSEMGMGGMMANSKPEVFPGASEMTLNVSVTYKLVE